MVKHETKKHKNKRPKKRGHSVLWLCVIILAAGGAYALLHYRKQEQVERAHTLALQPARFDEPAKKGTLKILTGPQFRDLYNSFAYPNTQSISETTPITGNAEADARIRTNAEKRGYMLRSAPVTDTFRDVGAGLLLQERAAQPWLDMQAAAKKDGEDLTLTAAYRSADEQKKILMAQLVASNILAVDIKTGGRDSQIIQILRTTAVPGYSRHHTGYTIDIGCENDPSVIFDYSSCFKWLSDDNYKNAKTYGWIPSYPPGAGDQGPDPETWEYVWVGTEALTE